MSGEILSPALPDIVQDIHDAMEKEITIYPVRSNWASKIGDVCERRAVHNRVDWDKKEKHSTTTEMIFFGGRVIERHIAKVYLEKAGYEIVEADRPIDTEASGTLRKLQISGKLDFVIRKIGEKQCYPVEVKSINAYDWEAINSVEDMTLSKKIWQRAYPAQLQLYLFGKEYETGLFLLINKVTYAPKVIWTQLDYDYVEKLLQKAARINLHVNAGTYPDRIEYQEKICGRCEYANVCLGDANRTAAQIITDAEIEENLDELGELKEKAAPTNDRIEELNDWKKSYFNGTEKALVGKWMVTGRMTKRKAFSVAESESWNVLVKKIT